MWGLKTPSGNLQRTASCADSLCENGGLRMLSPKPCLVFRHRNILFVYARLRPLIGESLRKTGETFVENSNAARHDFFSPTTIHMFVHQIGQSIQ